MATTRKQEARPKRRYDSSRRSEQAAETRRRIVEAAAACFAESGYARTTLAAVAARADVSVESVTANGPKRALLIAAFSQTFAGVETEGTVLTGDPWTAAFAAGNAAAVLDAVADLVVAGQQRGHGIWRAVSAAAVQEPEVAELYAALSERRRADNLRGVLLLGERGLLRRDRTAQQLADTMALLNGFDPYQLYVVEFGWSLADLKSWYVDTVRRTVLRPDVV